MNANTNTEAEIDMGHSAAPGLSMKHLDEILSSACEPGSGGVRLPCLSEKERASLRTMLNSRRHLHLRRFDNNNTDIGMLDKQNIDISKLRNLRFRKDPISCDLFLFTFTFFNKEYSNEREGNA